MSEDSILPPEVEAKLKADGVEYVAIRTKAGPCAFKGLTREQYNRVQTFAKDPKTASRAGEQACNSALVYPELHVFQAYINKYPGILVKCYDLVLTESGVDLEAETKKSVSESSES